MGIVIKALAFSTLDVFILKLRLFFCTRCPCLRHYLYRIANLDLNVGYQLPGVVQDGSESYSIRGQISILGNKPEGNPGG